MVPAERTGDPPRYYAIKRFLVLLGGWSLSKWRDMLCGLLRLLRIDGKVLMGVRHGLTVFLTVKAYMGF